MQAKLAITLLICFLMAPHAASSGAGGRDAARDSLWISDIEFFARELPARHIDLFFKLSEEEFHQQVNDLKAAVPDLEDYEIVVNLMRIVASVGDSHTMLNAGQAGVFHKLPLELAWFSDGLYVTEALPQYEGILGKRVEGIEGVDIETVIERVRTVVSCDNDMQLKTRGPASMVIPEVLAALSFTAGTDSVIFNVEGAGDVSIEAMEGGKLRDQVGILDSLDCELPLYLQMPESVYWYRYIEGAQAVYVQYRACAEIKGRPFNAFADGLFAFIDSHDARKLIFDMRLNHGGNSAIARPVIDGVKARAALNRKGHLFVIIGRDTYSSAVLNALHFQNETEAIFVGEPTGGKPNHYGEVKFFILPNTWATVTYSTKYFTLSQSDAPFLCPDIDAAVSFRDFISCRDPALEAILKYEAGAGR